MVEVAVTNSYVLQKWFAMKNEKKPQTEGNFRDRLVRDIVAKYNPDRIPIGNFSIRHGSQAFGGKRRICIVCHKRSSRHCPDCPFTPALCQSTKRDCHGQWHCDAHHTKRQRWFSKQKRKYTESTIVQLSKKRGRPKGSKDKRRRTVH